MDEVELWEAWTACQAARERWLISDPLGFPEFEVAGVPPSLEGILQRGPEVDFVWRPKQGGGVRLEVFTDVFTSTLLQSVANRIARSAIDFGPALSSRASGSQSEVGNAYETWSSSVVPWLRRQLTRGRSALLTDVRDYFGSIRRTQLEATVHALSLDSATAESTLKIIDGLNAAPDASGRTRSGLPVCPHDLVWMLADLVFRPIDTEIQGIQGVESYARWIDDLFVAVDRKQVSPVLQFVRGCVEARGFRLNDGKTQILTDLHRFDEVFFVREHEAFDTLFRSARKGFLPADEAYFVSLLARLEDAGVQTDRILKRAYSLAAIAETPMLIDRAGRDLARHPTAELSILAYLGRLDWPGDSIRLIRDALVVPETDSRLLGAMRMLLRFPPSPEKRQVVWKTIEDDLVSGCVARHPFYLPLALGLVLDMDEAAVVSLAEGCVDVVSQLPSATARRVACEILLAIPTTRKAALELISIDPSPTVFGLARLVDPDQSAKPPSRLHSVLTRNTSHQLSWGGLTTRLAHAVLSPALHSRPETPTPRAYQPNGNTIVVIIGQIGSGKTTAGERLATALNGDFVQIDALPASARAAMPSVLAGRVTEALQSQPLLFECSGTSERFEELLAEFEAMASCVWVVKVLCPNELALKRQRSRKPWRPPVSGASWSYEVVRTAQRLRRVPADLTLDSSDLDAEALVQAMQDLLRLGRQASSDTNTSRAQSFSRLALHERCPLAYAFKHVRGESEVFLSAKTLLGQLVHRALSRLYEDREESGETSLSALLNELHQGLDELPKGSSEPNLRDQLERSGCDILTFHFENAFRHDHLKTLHVDHRFTLDLGMGRTITGQIDRVALTESKIPVVIDYKTGSDRETYLSDVPDLLQLEVYGAALLVERRTKAVEVRRHAVRSGREECYGLTEKDLPRIRASMTRWIRKVEQSRYPEAKPGKVCEWCAFNPRCPSRSRPAGPGLTLGA